MSEMARAPIEGRVLDDFGWEIIEWRDIDYLVRVKADDVFMDFDVYEIIGYVMDDPRPLLRAGYLRHEPDSTQDFKQAESLIHGRVKWDGCSDWAWNTDQIMWHGCGPMDVANLAEAMRRTYALAADRINGWNPEP